MVVLDDLRQTVAQLAETAGPSVVRINQGRGSGVVLSAGLVLTNAHNVVGRRDEAAPVEVMFSEERRAEATLKGIDGPGDLAVLEVDTGSAAPLAWGAPAATVGLPVFALANPRGLRVTFGLVSNVSQAFRGPAGDRIAGAIEHTAPLARGSSGGPIVDAEGRVLGINTHRVGDGFYLALPADDALRARLEQLGRGESPARPRLGVALAPAQAARKLRAAVGLPDRDGLLVRAVEEGSPADAAGVRQGDLLVRAGATALVTHDDLYGVLAGLDADAPLMLAVVRGADELELTVSFSAR